MYLISILRINKINFINQLNDTSTSTKFTLTLILFNLTGIPPLLTLIIKWDFEEKGFFYFFFVFQYTVEIWFLLLLLRKIFFLSLQLFEVEKSTFFIRPILFKNKLMNDFNPCFSAIHIVKLISGISHVLLNSPVEQGPVEKENFLIFTHLF